MSQASVSSGRRTFGEMPSPSSTIASSVAHVEFVYPKESGKKRRYTFGHRRHSLPASSSQPSFGARHHGSPSHSNNNSKTTESIDEILQTRKKKKGQRDNYSEAVESFDDSPLQSKANDDDSGNTGDRRDAHESAGRVSKRQRQEQDDGEHPSNSQQHLSGVSVEDVMRDREGCRPRSNSTDGELNLPQRGLCDERLVLQSYQWNPSVVHQKIPKGLHNLGNTCFLNSTLQCLAYLPPFVQSLLSIDRDELTSGKHGRVSKGKKVTLLMQDLFHELHNQNRGQQRQHQKQHKVVRPQRIVDALPWLNAYNRGGYKFRPGRQEDAHEFLVHLLDAMNDGELQHAGINQQASGWRDRLPIARLDQTTLVHRVFGGYFRSQVKCTNCDYKSNTYDPFFDLSLEISRDGCSSLQSAIKDFSRCETLDSDNRWQCSQCRKRVRATKQLTVFRAPLSLCVQFKRFSYSEFSLGGGGGGFGHGRYGGYGNAGRKISRRIQYPAVLKLDLSDGRKCEYQLTGAVVHLGHSATSGHYTAFVRKPVPGGSHRWFQMDDSFVEPVEERNVLQEKDAYLLFYSRTKVPLDLPGPPPEVQQTQPSPRSRHAEKSPEAVVREERKQAKRSTSQQTQEMLTPDKPKDSVKRAKVSAAEPPTEETRKHLAKVQGKEKENSVQGESKAVAKPADSDREKNVASSESSNGNKSVKAHNLQKQAESESHVKPDLERYPQTQVERKARAKPTDSGRPRDVAQFLSPDEKKKKNPPGAAVWSKAVISSIEKGASVSANDQSRSSRPDALAHALAKGTTGGESCETKPREKRGRQDSSIGESSGGNNDTSGSSTGSSSSDSSSSSTSGDSSSEEDEQSTVAQTKRTKSMKNNQKAGEYGGVFRSMYDNPEEKVKGQPGNEKRKKGGEAPLNHGRAKHTSERADEANALGTGSDVPPQTDQAARMPKKGKIVPEKAGKKRVAVKMPVPKVKHSAPYGSKRKNANYGSFGSDSKSRLALLGNTPTSTWNEEDGASRKSPSSRNSRAALEKTMQKQKSANARALHADKWDAHIDQGRTKKPKKKPSSPFHEQNKNNFQQVQDNKARLKKGVESMHRRNNPNANKTRALKHFRVTKRS